MRCLLLSSLISCAFLTSPAVHAEEPVKDPAVKPRTKVLVLDVKSGDLQKSEVETLTGLITAKLARYAELEVLSGQDLKRLVDLEAQKQAAGCDEAGCLAEMAGALGAQIVIFGQAGRLGGTLVVTLDAFDAAKGVAVARQPIEARDLGQLPGLVGPAVDRLVAAAFQGKGGTSAPGAGDTLHAGGPILSGRAREVFDQSALDLCVDNEKTTLWWFCDKNSRYTENAFVRKYREVTGQRDLDAYEVNRNTASVVWPSLTIGGGAVLVVASLPVLYFSVVDKSTVPALSTEINGTNVGLAAGSLGLLAGLGLSAWGGWMMLEALEFTDGKPSDHTLKEAAAREAVERHNSALGAKLDKDFAPSTPPASAP